MERTMLLSETRLQIRRVRQLIKHTCYCGGPFASFKYNDADRGTNCQPFHRSSTLSTLPLRLPDPFSRQYTSPTSIDIKSNYLMQVSRSAYISLCLSRGIKDKKLVVRKRVITKRGPTCLPFPSQQLYIMKRPNWPMGGVVDREPIIK